MKKILIVDGSLAKAHVSSYTRSDGTFVKEHDNGRQAAAPKPAAGGRAAGKAKAPAFDHPNVVAHNARMTSSHYEPGKGSKEAEAKDAADADTVHFAGKRYSWTSKTGKSNHDGTPVRAFEHEESGHRVWVDDKRRVHADSTDEVDRLRKEHADHEAKQGAGKAPAKKAAAKPAGGSDHQKLVDAATYSGGQYEEHSKTVTDGHASRSIRVGNDKAKAHEHAHETLVGAGFKPAGNDPVTGANKYESGSHTAEIDHNNGVMHVSVKAKAAAPAKKVVVRKEAAPAGGDNKPTTWQEAQEHAFKAGAKFKSSVAVFNSADRAHSYADRSAGSKGGAFVMKHPDHNFHMVVNGADSQRMAKNGYQYVRPGRSDR